MINPVCCGRIICWVLFFCSGVVHTLQAQVAIPIGSWRTHFSYHRVSHVVAAQERMYGAAQNGLFYFDKKDQNLYTLSTTNGLSDAGVSAMAYQPSSEVLLLAYRSGVIDMLFRNRIRSFTLIRDASEAEFIHHIHFHDNLAYLSTSKGVRVLELSVADGPNIEIRESYTNLSSTGDNLVVYSSTIVSDSIFLATEDGIIAASLSQQVNRQDYRSWRRFGVAEGIIPQSVKFIAALDNQVYAGMDGHGLFMYNGTTWQATEIVTDHQFEALRADNSQLMMILGDSVILYDREHMTVVKDNLISQPQDVVIDHQGILWIGDSQHGLVRRQDDVFSSFLPEGPASDSISSLHYLNNRVIALKSGLSTGKGAFYTFHEGNWTNYGVNSAMPDVALLLDAEYDTVKGQYYFATFGSGILRWNGEHDFNLITTGDGENAFNNDQITALAIDRNLNLWITNFNAAAPLHHLGLSDGIRQSFAFSQVQSRFPVKMVLAEDGNPWLLLHDNPALSKTGSDILVFRQDTEEHLLIRDKISVAAWPGREITDMVRDRNGQIWIGGNEGVAYFPNPWGIFSETSIIKPIFETQFLLLGEYVTCMAVDGGNSKWIGTRNGLWLFNETGEGLIHHFTTENSPLMSNVIVDIVVNDKDGEVFVATDQGLISYRGTATEGAQKHQAVKVFPNPVPSHFDGMVGIQGLATDVSVKITNLAGTLIRQLEAEGGTVSWDIRDYRGQRVGSGVYLIFSATEDGEETFVGKVAVIH